MAYIAQDVRMDYQEPSHYEICLTRPEIEVIVDWILEMDNPGDVHDEIKTKLLKECLMDI